MADEIKFAKFKRKQYLVSKEFQLKYVGMILLFIFLTAALCSYVVYYTSMILLGEKLANVYPQGRLVSIVRIVNFRILLSVLLVSPLVAIIGIFLSHKIAGPIYRIEKFLANMATGDLSARINLRQGDELITIAEAINKMSESLKYTISGQKEQLKKVVSELEELKKVSSSRPQDVAFMKNNIDRLESEINDLRRELDIYKL